MGSTTVDQSPPGPPPQNSSQPIERLNKRVDHPTWVALINEIIEAFGLERRLPTFRLFNEAPHRFPQRNTGDS
jgi:hypothetical protein